MSSLDFTGDDVLVVPGKPSVQPPYPGSALPCGSHPPQTAQTPLLGLSGPPFSGGARFLSRDLGIMKGQRLLVAGEFRAGEKLLLSLTRTSPALQA